MSKAILVMDMPNKCGECSLRMAMICTPTMKDIDSVNAKMDWCPLVEVPTEVANSLEKYAERYNACIDEIMKGSEENE